MSEHVLPAEGPMRFISPIIQDNPTGWGPYEMPDQFRDMPYQPFSKGDRLGKISDWTMVQDKKYQNKYASQFGAGSSYAYFHDEDESTFHLVDTTRVQKPYQSYQRGRARGQRGRGARGARTPGGMTTLNKPRERKLGKRWGQRGAPMKIRDASVTVRPTWVTIEDMDFPRLAKLSLPGIKEGEDIVSCGTLEYYDKAYDRVNVKHEKPLQRIDRIFHTNRVEVRNHDYGNDLLVYRSDGELGEEGYASTLSEEEVKYDPSVWQSVIRYGPDDLHPASRGNPSVVTVATTEANAAQQKSEIVTTSDGSTWHSLQPVSQPSARVHSAQLHPHAQIPTHAQLQNLAQMQYHGQLQALRPRRMQVVPSIEDGEEDFKRLYLLVETAVAVRQREREQEALLPHC